MNKIISLIALTTALIISQNLQSLNAQTLIVPNATWNTRNTITGRYDVKIVGASAYMPSDKAPYTTCPAPNDRNNDYPNRPYADVDSDSTTFQSSTSTYNSTDSCSKIAKAYLYWTGSRRTATPAITDAQAVSCKIKDKNGVYQNITAEYWYKQQYDGSLVDGNMQPYICYADVSAHLSGMTGGEFAVANIYTSTYVANNNGGQIGAWSIVLVYESQFYTQKTIKFWDNLINSGYGKINPTSIVLSGLDVPATGTIDAFFGMMALDADADGNTHTLTVQSNNGGVSTPLNNFFSSSIAMNEVDVQKNIDCDNTLGFDAQHRDLPNGTIANGATQITMTYTTTDGLCFLPVAYVGVEINESGIELKKEASTDSVKIGGSYTYILSANNYGGLPSDAGAYLWDTLNIPIDYRDGSAVFEQKDELGNIIAAPVGIVTTYTPVDKTLAFTNIPSIDAGHTFIFTYTVDVKSSSESSKIISPKAEFNYNGNKVSYSNEGSCGYGDNTYVYINHDCVSPTANAGANQSICHGEAVVIGGSPSASGGSGSYSYSWSPSDGLNETSIANPISTITKTTTYKLLVTDAIGCTATDDVTIHGFISANTIPDTTIGYCTSIQLKSVIKEGLPSKYLWKPSTALSDSTILSPIIKPNILSDGPHSYTLSVTDINNCIATTNVTITIDSISVYTIPDTTIGYCKSLQLVSVINKGTPSAYFWKPSCFQYDYYKLCFLDSSNVLSPTIIPNILTHGKNTFSLEVTDIYNCSAKTEVDVLIDSLFVSTINDQTIGSCETLVLTSFIYLGSGDFSYEWTPKTALDNPKLLNPTINTNLLNIGSYNYTITVTDKYGCATYPFGHARLV